MTKDQSTEWHLVVVGGVSWDFLVRGPRLPTPGEAVQGGAFHEGPGGKGANQAVAAARLGARVALIARVGTDHRGERLVARLAHEGVETRFIRRDDSAPTGVTLIALDPEGAKQSVAALGANCHLSVGDVRAAAGTIAASRVVLAQLEVPLETVTAAVVIGDQAGARTVLDPAPATQLSDDLLQLLAAIKPNASEAGALTGVRVRGRASARAAAEVLLRRGVGAVAVQAGDEGNLLVSGEDELWLPLLPVESVDPTGAGDAFAAALAVALAEDRTLAEAGLLASATAALATTALGAQTALPRRDAAHSLLAQARRMGWCADDDGIDHLMGALQTG